MILRNLLVGLPTMLLCMVVQVAFAFWSVRYYVRHSVVAKPSDGAISGIGPLLITMLVMMSGTVVQIIIWGFLFVLLGEFQDLYTAIYHSAVNFASLGYGDIVMTENRKLLGPLEAVCGVLMLGMSAAALMAILQQMIKSQQDALQSSSPKLP